MPKRFSITRIQEAVDTPFDNSINGFTADNTQEAIEEIGAGGGSGASPGFTWGKSGNVSSGAYLVNDTVPSNLAGRIMPVTGLISEVFASNENSNTFTIAFEKMVSGVWTEITSISLSSQRVHNLAVSVSISKGDEIAAKVKSGSGKNIVAGMVVKGALL